MFHFLPGIEVLVFVVFSVVNIAGSSVDDSVEEEEDPASSVFSLDCESG